MIKPLSNEEAFCRTIPGQEVLLANSFPLPMPQKMTDYLARYGLTEDELAQSYANCADLGLERNCRAPKIIRPRSEVQQIKETQCPYLKAAFPTLFKIYQDLPADFACFLTDRQLINLCTIANSAMVAVRRSLTAFIGIGGGFVVK